MEEGVRFSNNCHQIILVNQFFFGIEVLICSSSYSHNFTYIEIPAFRQVLHARKLEERACPEFLHNSRCRLAVLGIEVGGRWSEETASFITTLARIKTRDIPAPFRPCCYLLPYLQMDSFPHTGGIHNLDGEPPSPIDLVAEFPPDPADPPHPP